MHSLNRLAFALAACFLLASCSSLRTPATAPHRPPPAAYSERCPAPPPAPPASGEVDPVAAALKEMYDLYGLCAGRLVDLLNWLDEGQQ